MIGQQYKNLNHFLYNFVVIGFVGMLIFGMGGDFIADKIRDYKIRQIEKAPTSDYFIYQSVEPEHPEYKIGEDLSMISTRIFFTGGDVYWADVLRCYKGEHVFFYSAYESSLQDLENHYILGVQQPGRWVYQSTTPKYETECYIDSHITLKFANKYGTFTKTQDVQTGPFKFKE